MFALPLSVGSIPDICPFARLKENLNLPKTAQDVYEYIGNEPVHIDKISADLKIPVFKVLTALTMLEMKDLVSALQGRNYILK